MSFNKQTLFQLGPRLSQGATCKVYDLRIKNVPVILKACRREFLGSALEKFINIRHDNIERIVQILHVPNSPVAYIFSECLDMTLYEWKSSSDATRPMNWLRANDVFTQCARGLAYIHNSLKLVHADVKNNNIMLHIKSGKLKLIDFSNAFELGKRVDGFDQTILTMCHVDLLRNSYDVGFKLDMWALAMTIYWFENNRHFVTCVAHKYFNWRDADSFENAIRKNARMRAQLADAIDIELKHLETVAAAGYFLQCLFVSRSTAQRD